MRACFCFALVLVVLASVLSWSAARTIQVASAADIAAASLQPGDELIMQAGEWRNQAIKFTGRGNITHPIKLVGSTSVTLTGSSRLAMSGSWLIATGLRFVGGYIPESTSKPGKGAADVVEFRSDSSTHCFNCTLRDSLIQDYNHPDPMIDYKWVSLYGQRNKLYKNTFINKAHMGALVVVWKRVPTGVPAVDEDRHSISFNQFIRREPVSGETNDQEAIRIGDSSTKTDSNTIIYSNYFEDMNGEVELISSKSHGNGIYNNTMVRCKGGITIRHGENNRIFENRFFGQDVSGTAGIRVTWGDKHRIYNNYFEAINPGGTSNKGAIVFVNGQPNYEPNGYKPITNVLVAFNTIKNCRSAIVFYESGNPIPANATTFVNNIILSNLSSTSSSSSTFIKYSSTAARPNATKWINNLIWSTAGSTVVAPKAYGDSNPTWKIANPLLGDRWYLQSASSPAVAAAVSGSLWNSVAIEDIEGKPRNADPNLRTIGAWEFTQQQ